jgi:CBS domain-containing protein
MKVKDVLQKDVITIRHDATHAEAAKTLYINNISGAPVVDGKGRLVGMISEKDLFTALYPSFQAFNAQPEFYLDPESHEEDIHEIKLLKVETFMRKHIITVTPETPILRAGAIMLAHGFHRLPVEQNGKLVGIVTRDHIYRAILKKHLDLS